MGCEILPNEFLKNIKESLKHNEHILLNPWTCGGWRKSRLTLSQIPVAMILVPWCGVTVMVNYVSAWLGQALGQTLF